jgi:hypothetical protein
MAGRENEEKISYVKMILPINLASDSGLSEIFNGPVRHLLEYF